MAISDDGIITALATLITPLAAIAISVWYQNRKQKREEKYKLFSSAMIHKKAFPPTVEWVNALNLIDVVFQDNPKIIQAWHKLYEYVYVRPMDMKLFEQKTLDLPSEMAKELGYPNLKQTDIDKFYNPEAHGNQAARVSEMQTELLRVLKNTQSLSATNKIDEVKQ